MLDADRRRAGPSPHSVDLLIEEARRLLDGAPSPAEVAALRAGLEALAPRDLLRFDEQSRSWRSSLPRAKVARLRWPLGRGDRKALWSVLALVSADGHERERAVTAARHSPLTARLLAIRCIDWVDQVRDAALRRLDQCPAPLLLEAFPLADQLAARRSRGAALDALLEARLSDDELRMAARAADRDTRRGAWRRLMSRGAPRFDELRDLVARDEDVVIRGLAASALDGLPCERRRTLARVLVADPVGSVATPALAALVGLDGAAAIEPALTGRSAAVRRAARDWAATRGVDARAIYLGRLREDPRNRLALTALAELGCAQDASLFREMVADERPRIRAAGLRALARVDPPAARAVAVEALVADLPGRVVRAATEILRPGPLSSAEIDAIVAITLDQRRPTARRFHALPLIRRSRWRHLAAVLEARAAAEDEAVRTRLDLELLVWIRTSRGIGRGPDAVIRERVERLLDTLGPEPRREIEFALGSAP